MAFKYNVHVVKKTSTNSTEAVLIKETHCPEKADVSYRKVFFHYNITIYSSKFGERGCGKKKDDESEVFFFSYNVEITGARNYFKSDIQGMGYTGKKTC
jgi:hypothetical protein